MARDSSDTLGGRGWGWGWGWGARYLYETMSGKHDVTRQFAAEKLIYTLTFFSPASSESSTALLWSKWHVIRRVMTIIIIIMYFTRPCHNDDVTNTNRVIIIIILSSGRPTRRRRDSLRARTCRFYNDNYYYYYKIFNTFRAILRYGHLRVRNNIILIIITIII